MAVYNEIGIGRWNRFIQKLTDMKGGPPARQLSSEIAFAHPIFHGVENRYLESWDRFAMTRTVPGVAAQTADWRMRNPAGSNVIAVIEQIIYENNSGGVNPSIFYTQMGPMALDLGTLVGVLLAGMDARGRQQSQMIHSITNQGALLQTAFAQMQLPTVQSQQVILTENQEIALLPGWAIQFSNATANGILCVSIMWRERFLEPAERF